MSHKSLRIALEKAALSIQDDVQYSYGRVSDLNQDGVDKFLIINVSPLVANSSFADNEVNNFSKAWNVEMVFAMMDTDAERYYESILDRCDDYVDRFIMRLNLVDTMVLTSINQTPFIKGYADVLTGYIVTFTATVTDDHDYCDEC